MKSQTKLFFKICLNFLKGIFEGLGMFGLAMVPIILFILGIAAVAEELTLLQCMERLYLALNAGFEYKPIFTILVFCGIMYQVMSKNSFLRGLLDAFCEYFKTE